MHEPADIAFGYELKVSAGMSWNMAGKFTGMTGPALRAACNRAIRDGIKKPR